MKLFSHRLDIWYEYNDKGNITREKRSDGYGYWYEYNDKNKLIYEKAFIKVEQAIVETWYDYDVKGNEIHDKEIWTTYDYDDQDNLVPSKEYSPSFSEYWYEYDAKGNELGRDSLQTAKEQTEMRLECESSVCRPGEMVFFRVRYTDQDGEVKPMEKHTVRIEAENGTVMGAVNASCSFSGNFAQSEAPSYFGEMQTVVQAGTAGILRVTASDGERSAAAEIPVEEG